MATGGSFVQPQRILKDKPMQSGFEYWKNIAETLHDGKMTQIPYVMRACRFFWQTGYYKPLQKILEQNPLILKKAERNIAEMEKAEEENPFRRHHYEDKLDKLMGEIEIGTTIPGGEPVGLNPVDLTQILAIYGVPKTGKTWLNIRILRQIFRMKGRAFNVIAIDRKLDFIHLFREHPNLWVLGAENGLFNIFEEKEGWLDAAQVIADENYFGASSHPIIEAAFYSSMIKNGIAKEVKDKDGEKSLIFQDSDNYPNYGQILDEVVEYVKARKLSGSGTWDVVSKIKTRLEQYIRMGSVFNCKKGFPLDFWLNNDIIINPDGMSRTVLRCFIIGLAHRIYRHFKKNNMRGDELRTLFLLDEGGWLLDAKRDYQDFTTNEALDDVLRMGREFGLGWIISAQQPNMVSRTVRENARFLVSFRVQSDSMNELQKDFGLQDDEKDYAKHQLPPKLTGIFSTPNYPGPVLFKMPAGE